MSYKWIRHVSCMNASCRTLNWSFVWSSRGYMSMRRLFLFIWIDEASLRVDMNKSYEHVNLVWGFSVLGLGVTCEWVVHRIWVTSHYGWDMARAWHTHIHTNTHAHTHTHTHTHTHIHTQIQTRAWTSKSVTNRNVVRHTCVSITKTIAYECKILTYASARHIHCIHLFICGWAMSKALSNDEVVRKRVLESLRNLWSNESESSWGTESWWSKEYVCSWVTG